MDAQERARELARECYHWGEDTNDLPFELPGNPAEKIAALIVWKDSLIEKLQSADQLAQEHEDAAIEAQAEVIVLRAQLAAAKGEAS